MVGPPYGCHRVAALAVGTVHKMSLLLVRGAPSMSAAPVLRMGEPELYHGFSILPGTRSSVAETTRTGVHT